MLRKILPSFVGALLLIGPAAHADILYMTDSTNNQILKIDSAGNASVFASTPAGARPSSLAFDSSANLYVAYNGGVGQIERFSKTGLDLGLFATPNNFGPTSLAFDSSQNLYVMTDGAGTGNADVETFNKSGVYLNSFVIYSVAAGFALDSSANTYLGDSNSFNVIKVSPSGVGLGAFASFPSLYVRGIALDGAGNVYISVTDFGSTYNLDKFSPTGALI